jgi:hypothetical protein
MGFPEAQIHAAAHVLSGPIHSSPDAAHPAMTGVELSLEIGRPFSGS